MKCRATTLLALALSGAAGAQTCDTTYLPSGTRVYELVSPQNKTTMTSRATVKGNKISVASTFGDKTTTTVWTCTANGLSAEIGAGGQQMQMDTGKLPPSRAWKAGHTWTTSGKLSSAQGMSMTYTTTSRIVKQEQVTTPAGTFTAWRVDAVTKTKFALPEGMKVPAGMSSPDAKSSIWYAKGAGMVKMKTDNVQMTLVKMSR